MLLYRLSTLRLREKAQQAGVCAALLSLVALTYLLPLENGVSVAVGTFFFGLGILLMQCVRDPVDRMWMTRLFVIAFLLRLVFTMLAYALGLIAVLGGADDAGWVFAWNLSLHWRDYLPDPPNVRGVPGLKPPDTFIEIVSGEYGKNRGWLYYAALFLDLIETPSQVSLACINNFLSSLTTCVIYRLCRDYFSHKASLLAAGAAVIFPGFIAWSALTIKEPWLIFLEIFVFYVCWAAVRDRKWWLLAVGLFFTVVTYTMRFYIGYVMVAALPFIFIGTRAANPRKTALSLAGVGVLAYAAASVVGVVQVDVLSIVADQMESLRGFGEATSGANGGTNGVTTGVVLDYDYNTPYGFFMLLMIGMAYLLLSPFPWSLTGKQLLALPDVAIWWILVFAFIVPGIRHAWRHQPGLSVAILSYLFPLILVYSFSFGNIGLAYRQRAQLMPFFLFFAAAGYDARRKKKEAEARGGQPNVDEILEKLREAAQSGALNPRPEPALRASRK